MSRRVQLERPVHECPTARQGAALVRWEACGATARGDQRHTSRMTALVEAGSLCSNWRVRGVAHCKTRLATAGIAVTSRRPRTPGDVCPGGRFLNVAQQHSIDRRWQLAGPPALSRVAAITLRLLILLHHFARQASNHSRPLRSPHSHSEPTSR